MDAYLGQIQALPYDSTFIPRGWALCNGASLSIRQFTALYAVIGTVYGGDGVSTFKLPDLQGRATYGAGYNGGAPALGRPQGSATVSLDQTQIAGHTHNLVGSTQTGTVMKSAGGAFATTGVAQKGGSKSGFNRYSTSATNVSLAPGSLSPSGSSTAHNNMQPYLGMTYFMCIDGLFPSRA